MKFTYPMMILAFLTHGCQKTEFKSNTPKALATAEQVYSQLTYPSHSRQFTQGIPGTLYENKFTQVSPLLDILIVIDNSGSMSEEQAEVANRMEALLMYVTEADWQISVVTTDNQGDCYRGLIKKSDLDKVTKFKNAILAGTDGDSDEQGLQQTIVGLQGACVGQNPWLRDNSVVASIIISDEDNCSNGNCGDNIDWAMETKTYLDSIRTTGENAALYGLIKKPGDATCTDARRDGVEYNRAVDLIGGAVGSICDANYTNTFKIISDDIANLLVNKYTLDPLPDDGEVKITIGDETFDDFTVEDDLLTFNSIPAAGTELSISYRSGREGVVYDRLPLDLDYVPESIDVQIGDTSLEQGTYLLDEQTNELVLPEDLQNVTFSVNWLEPIPLKYSFDVASDLIRSEGVTVYVDQEIFDTTITYDDDRGRVELNPPPPQGSSISLFYKLRQK